MMAVVGREKAKAGTNPTEERGRIGGSSLRRGSNLLFTRAHKLARPPPVAQRTRFGSSYIRLCSGDGGAQMLHASPAPPSHAPYMSTPPSVLNCSSRRDGSPGCHSSIDPCEQHDG